MEATLKPFKDQIRSGNNSREIVRGLEKKLVKVRDNPSGVLAQELEDKFGIVVDYKEGDEGNGPINYRE